jgi:putative N6-adenine-specific DNA methylase
LSGRDREGAGQRRDCVATCRPGLEGVLLQEIEALGGQGAVRRKRAVEFHTDTAGLYRMNMALRTALHVLVPLRHFNARDYDLLYFQARRTNWHHYFDVEKRLRIDVTGRSPNLPNSQYTIHRIKDGIVDTFRKITEGTRPSIDKGEPEVQIMAHLDGNRVSLFLDSSGPPLFKRGYRTEHGGAPLKEDLAAGILQLSGLTEATGLLDPMCGSGTFLFEGWMLLNDVAPNRERDFAFCHWKDYDPELHARERAALRGPADAGAGARPVLGSDNDPAAIELAQRIREAAFAGSNIQLRTAALSEEGPEVEGGLMVVNPPYGERMGGDATALQALYREIGGAAKRRVPGGKLALFTTNRQAAKAIHMRAGPALTLFNGALEGLLYPYSVRSVRG